MIKDILIFILLILVVFLSLQVDTNNRRITDLEHRVTAIEEFLMIERKP